MQNVKYSGVEVWSEARMLAGWTSHGRVLINLDRVQLISRYVSPTTDHRTELVFCGEESVVILASFEDVVQAIREAFRIPVKQPGGWPGLTEEGEQGG